MPKGANGLIAGIIEFKINGEVMQAKGNFTMNYGKPKVEPILGSDNSIHGMMGKTQAGKITGEITDRLDLSVEDLVTLRNADITLSFANGKVGSLSNASFTGDGDVNTEEANIPVEFQGEAEEIR